MAEDISGAAAEFAKAVTAFAAPMAAMGAGMREFQRATASLGKSFGQLGSAVTKLTALFSASAAKDLAKAASGGQMPVFQPGGRLPNGSTNAQMTMSASQYARAQNVAQYMNVGAKPGHMVGNFGGPNAVSVAQSTQLMLSGQGGSRGTMARMMFAQGLGGAEGEAAAGAAGGVSALGALGVAAGVAAAALALAASMASSYASAMRDNISASVRSGAYGVAGAAQSLHGLAGGLGIGDADLGSKARSLGDLLTQGGIAGSMAAALGIQPYGGLGGDQNYLSKYSRALQAIGNMPDDRRAGVFARQMGMEDQLWIRDLSKEHRDELFQRTGGMDMSPDKRRKFAEEQYALNKATAEFMDMWREFGSSVMPVIVDGLKGLMKLFGVGHEDNASALTDNTAALERNTGAVNENTQMTDGTYGGGQNFSGAGNVPIGWGMQTVNQALRGGSLRAGALTI